LGEVSVPRAEKWFERRSAYTRRSQSSCMVQCSCGTPGPSEILDRDLSVGQGNAFEERIAVEPLRLRLRDTASRILGLVPEAAVQRLRRAHRQSRAGSVGHQVYSGLLRVLRYRHLDRRMEFLRLEDFDLSLYNDNSVLTKRLYYLGEYESSEAYWWKYFCARAQVVVEFGANTGFYTIVGARSPGIVRYTAVEPHPYCAAVLRRNIAANGVERATVIEAAVVGTAHADTMDLWIPIRDADMTPTGGSLDLNRHGDGRARQRIPVRVAEARQYLGAADLLKLDIEGQEFEVLHSVEGILAERRPTIFVEVLKRNVQLRDYIPQLSKVCGYEVYAIGPTALHHVTVSEVSQGDHYRQFGTRDLILTVRGNVP